MNAASGDEYSASFSGNMCLVCVCVYVVLCFYLHLFRSSRQGVVEGVKGTLCVDQCAETRPLVMPAFIHNGHVERQSRQGNLVHEDAMHVRTVEGNLKVLSYQV